MKYTFEKSIQKTLTEKWLLPHKESIIQDLHQLRKELDARLRQDPEIIKHLNEWKKDYPIGLCAEIRNEMLNLLTKEIQYGKREGIKIIKEFIKEGGKITPFWGIDKDMYFENAILLGDAVLDVANDTVEPHKNPIEFYPSVEDSVLLPVESFTKVAEISEKYWNYDVYPNIYFPNLAPAYPLISIVKAHRGEDDYIQGLILQGDFAEFNDKNLNTVRDGHLFGLSFDFIFTSSYSTKRLPPQMLDMFLKSASLQKFKGIDKKMFYISVDPKDAYEAFSQFNINEKENSIPDTITLKIKQMKASGEKLKGVILCKIIK